MRHIPNLLLLIITLMMLPSVGRLQTVYTFQQDDTVLRNNYWDQSLMKKEALMSSVGGQHAKDYKSIYKDQFEMIRKLWQSTRPITSPQVHAYLQSILQTIIAVNPELKDTDARVVFSRDWWPNAVSMGDGTIAINAGLVMYMDNEAELVFVICHELAHYYLEHTPKTIKRYIETINSESYQAELKRLSKQQYMVNRQVEQLAKSVAFNSHRHSRENEAEADRQAFLFMKRTGYDLQAIRTTLELLDKVDDTLLFQPLNLETVFHFPDYPFKKKWIQKESMLFAAVEDNSSLSPEEKDSLKTHPECSKRIALVADSIGPVTGGKKFLVNEALFRQLKKDFFFEITEECFREENLSRHLYYSLLLLSAGENKPFAVYAVARCLNQLYEKQKEHKLGSAIDKEGKHHPEDYNTLLRMLSRIRLEEIASINYHFCRQYADEMKDHRPFSKEMGKAQQFKGP